MSLPALNVAIAISDQRLLAGVRAARLQHNAALAEGETPIDTDEAYVQWVMAEAAESYAVHLVDGAA